MPDCTVVATAITVQSGTGLRASWALPAARVAAQLDELLANLPVRAAKLGQVPGERIAAMLGRRLARAGIPVVVDPVLRASGGGTLAAAKAARAIARSLFPVATLVTVNLDEASFFAGIPVRDVAGMRRAAGRILDLGACAVLVKGGHLAGAPVDLLCTGSREVAWRGRRLRGSLHGTGCALALPVDSSTSTNSPG